jgi:hypothetical protein
VLLDVVWWDGVTTAAVAVVCRELVDDLHRQFSWCRYSLRTVTHSDRPTNNWPIVASKDMSKLIWGLTEKICHGDQEKLNYSKRHENKNLLSVPLTMSFFKDPLEFSVKHNRIDLSDITHWLLYHKPSTLTVCKLRGRTRERKDW